MQNLKRSISRTTVSAGAGASATLVTVRHAGSLHLRTKGNPHMKHLDIYARRDPQLAPYLLREVDIEFKRKCRKVDFIKWMIIFTIVTALQTRLHSEEYHYLCLYAMCMRAEQAAKDDDNMIRRRAFLGVMNVVKDAFYRDQKWRKSDQQKALACLRDG